MPEIQNTLPNFWEKYPDAIAVEDFAFLKNKCGDDKSSRIMWYIRLMNDPEHEYISRYPKAEREEIAIKITGFKKSDMKLEGYKRAEKWYVDRWLSPAAVGKVIIGDKIHEANDALQSKHIDSVEAIGEYTSGIKAYKILKTEYDEFCEMFKQQRTNRVRLFGKEDAAGDAADGSLFKRGFGKS